MSACFEPAADTAVSTLPIETYVARVLAGEAARDSRPAALEALAIADPHVCAGEPRPPPRRRLRPVRPDPLPGAACRLTPATEARGAGDRRPRRLLRNGAPASIYYTASCGGRTEIPSAVWPGRRGSAVPAVARRRRVPGRAGLDRGSGGGGSLRARCAPPGFVGDRLARRAHRRRGRVRDAWRGCRSTDSIRRRFPDRTCASPSAARSAGSTSRARRSIFVARATITGSAGTGRDTASGCASIGSAKLAERGRSADEILARYIPGFQSAGSAPRRSRRRPRLCPSADDVASRRHRRCRHGPRRSRARRQTRPRQRQSR